MRRLPDLTGKTFGYLTALRRLGPGHKYLCRCKCATYKMVSASNLNSGHTQSCGCYNKERLKEVHTGHTRNKGRIPPNWVDRKGTRHHKLTFVKYLGKTKWLCLCDCGNESVVSSLNLSRTTGCRHCAKRMDITGEKIALLTAVEMEAGPLKGRPPLWTFSCVCGGSIQGEVREFHGGSLRSCGCHDNAKGSWGSMMSRCYNKKDVRYNSYGARGIKVVKAWHDFDNFIKDMGERPKRHNLGRKRAEEDYGPDNCKWEHISLNCRDTKNDGMPTKPGLRKGAKARAVKAK